MSVVRQFLWATLSGDSSPSLSGGDSLRIHPASGSTPRLVAIVGNAADGVEIAIHNLSGQAIPLVHRKGGLSDQTQQLIMTGLGGDFILPDGQIVWGIKVDPNDTVLEDAGKSDARGWYVDSGGQEAFAREAATPTTSAPTKTNSTPATIPEMTITHNVVGGDVLVSFSMGLEMQDGDAGTIQLYVDGSAVAHTLRELAFDVVSGHIDGSPAFSALITGLSAGSHVFDVRWACTAGTLRANALERSLYVVEIP